MPTVANAHTRTHNPNKSRALHCSQTRSARANVWSNTVALHSRISNASEPCRAAPCHPPPCAETAERPTEQPLPSKQFGRPASQPSSSSPNARVAIQSKTKELYKFDLLERAHTRSYTDSHHTHKRILSELPSKSPKPPCRCAA